MTDRRKQLIPGPQMRIACDRNGIARKQKGLTPLLNQHLEQKAEQVVRHSQMQCAAQGKSVLKGQHAEVAMREVGGFPSGFY